MLRYHQNPCFLLFGLALLLAAHLTVAQTQHPSSGSADSVSVSLKMTRHYLSRAITMQTLPDASPAERQEDIAMLQRTGAYFVGRVGGFWDGPHSPEEDRAGTAATRQVVEAIHRQLPGAIVQGSIFEVVGPYAANLQVPTAVLQAFGLDSSKGPRPFQFKAMMYKSYFSDPRSSYRWGTGEQVSGTPDMSQLETQLWFYDRACRLIDAGCEAIHFGQVQIMDDQDPGHHGWWALLKRVRAYARTRNRGFVLCDAHTTGSYYDPDPEHPLPTAQRQLLFDFHSAPARPRETDTLPTGAQSARLERRPSASDSGTAYGESGGGVTPSGEVCEHLPFLVELDNGGMAPKPGQRNGLPWVWGYDEISWFALQLDSFRSQWLIYANQRVHALDPDAFLEMPGRRNLSGSPYPERIYRATTHCSGTTCEGQEETIRDIWAGKLRKQGQVLELIGPILP